MSIKKNINDEAIPIQPPKPSTIPKLYSTQYNLNITPEKLHVKIINEGLPVGRQRNVTIKKKVVFQENNVKDTNGVTEILKNDCLFSKPSMNSTKSIINKIEKNKNLTFNQTKTLKEIQNTNLIQRSISEQNSNVLNYKLTDTKYKDLISIEVDENELQFKKQKIKFKSKEKQLNGKPNIFDLWNKEDFITETPKLDFNIELNNDDEIIDKKEEDDFEFLFDLYKCNEVIPFQ